MAKSYIKPKYWDEEKLMRGLMSYIDKVNIYKKYEPGLGVNVDKMRKIGIIPYQGRAKIKLDKTTTK